MGHVAHGICFAYALGLNPMHMRGICIGWAGPSPNEYAMHIHWSMGQAPLNMLCIFTGPSPSPQNMHSIFDGLGPAHCICNAYAFVFAHSKEYASHILWAQPSPLNIHSKGLRPLFLHIQCTGLGPLHMHCICSVLCTRLSYSRTLVHAPIPRLRLSSTKPRLIDKEPGFAGFFVS